MAKELNTRIQLKHGLAAKWTEKNPVLLAGEIGIETDTLKMKVGNGTSNWSALGYLGADANDILAIINENRDSCTTVNVAEGQSDTDALATISNPKNGDTAVLIKVISGDKKSYTAFVYDNAWKAMDGNYNAKNVYFDKNLTYTANIGVKTVPSSGSGTIAAEGKNVEEVLASILAEEKNPSKTAPTITIGTQTNFGTFEIGTKKNLVYGATLSAGSYTYGPATGITAQSWEASCTGIEDKKSTASGTFENIVAEATPKKITVKATYNEGAVPKTNLGNPYPEGKITAGSTSKDSDTLVGVRHMFYGALTEDTALTSGVIRGLKHEAAAKKTITTFGAGSGAKKVVIACPAGYNVTKVLMPSAMNADATASFVRQSATVNVEGAEGYTAVAYNVWVYQPASIDSTETYAVTIG